MLPFLKNNNEGAASGPPEPEVREHDEDFDMFDAIAEDILQAIEKKDKGILKSALAAFADHLRDMDEQQDEGIEK